MDYQKMIESSVEKIKENLKLSNEEIMVLVNYISSIRMYNFLRKYRLDITPEVLYLRVYGISKPPKCKFCDKPCEFISFQRGFRTHCNTKQCKSKIIKNSFVVKNEKRKLYDEFLETHKDFYNSINFPFVDICNVYKNRNVKSLKQFKERSLSSLECLNEERECIFCKQKFVFNKFKNNKLRCNSKKCRSVSYNEVIDEYKNYSEIPIELFIENKRYKILNNDKLLYFYKKYGTESLSDFIKGKSIEYGQYILKRPATNISFSYVYNNIIEEDMKSVCRCCGKEYIKFDKIVSNNNLEKVKVGAEFSCGNQECYFKCVGFYEYSDEARKKQSNLMKEKIKAGEFTPFVTNSWAHSKISLSKYNLNFRSSWEAYFYIFMTEVLKIDLLYEKTRIPYFDSEKGVYRNYIVDFTDVANRILIEVKPNSEKDSKRVKDKEHFALEWCKAHNFRFKYISDDWFDKFYNSIIIRTEVFEKETRDKLLNNLREFENGNN